jgi:hypothetical protein
MVQKKTMLKFYRGNGNSITGNGMWILKRENLVRKVVAEM